jgi:RNA polymerase sigma factor (sigma-70 family)
VSRDFLNIGCIHLIQQRVADRRRDIAPALAPAGDDGQEGQRALERQEVVEALRTIDERYRMPLYLKFYERYTAYEIARTLMMPENTVYTNISRGKQQLKEVLSRGNI